MKMKKFVFVLSIFLSLEIIAQNLITNPSFEIISSCPDDMGQVWHATGWNHAFKFTNASGIINNPSLSASCSTDLFASCSSCAAFNFQPPDLVCSPYGFGCNPPFDGENYAGAGLLCTSGAREMLQNFMKEPLVQNRWYRLSMYVRPLVVDYFSLPAEVLEYSFTQDTLICENMYNCTIAPRSIFPVGIISDATVWAKVETFYLANGGEKCMTIGYFGKYGETHLFNGMSMQEFENKQLSAYYFIDQVEVEALTIQPNVFTPNGDGINDVWFLPSALNDEEINIYNRWGQCVNTIIGHESWDGLDKNSRILKEGNFYYISKNQKLFGFITKI
jgi:gliding motility-associated-like protein